MSPAKRLVRLVLRFAAANNHKKRFTTMTLNNSEQNGSTFNFNEVAAIAKELKPVVEASLKLEASYEVEAIAPLLDITSRMNIFISILKNYALRFSDLLELEAEFTQYDSSGNEIENETEVFTVIKEAHNIFISSAWEAFILTYIIQKLETHQILLQPYQSTGIDAICNSCKQGKKCFDIFCLPQNGTEVFDYYNKKHISLTRDTQFSFEQIVETGEYVAGEIDYFDYFACSTNGTFHVLKVTDCKFYAMEVEDHTTTSFS